MMTVAPVLAAGKAGRPPLDFEAAAGVGAPGRGPLASEAGADRSLTLILRCRIRVSVKAFAFA